MEESKAYPLKRKNATFICVLLFLKPIKRGGMMSKKVAVIGSGGREHALAWNIAKSPEVSEVLCLPGNPGMEEGKCKTVPIDGTKKDNFPDVLKLIKEEKIDMAVIGPEGALDDGIVDYLAENGFNKVFGPSQRAAAIESDKFYSYDVMDAAGIKQALSAKCSSTEDAITAIEKMANKKGIVIKARGLTAGKGVTVCDTKEEALTEIKQHAGLYGPQVLISERLYGQEFSVFGISDGNMVYPIELSFQDHKPLLEGDKGPNTGGMGAYGPAPIAPKEILKEVVDKIMNPTVKQMKKQGDEFKGFLYAGIIMTEDGPKVIEFNARFGDPECQPAMMILKEGLYKPLSLALAGKLDKVNIDFNEGATCCVVLASNGYPLKYDKGVPIGGLNKAAKLKDVKVFHAGTAAQDGKIVTNGGRVLGVTAHSSLEDPKEAVREAQQKAYKAVKIIDDASTELNNKKVFIFRNDVAAKALK